MENFKDRFPGLKQYVYLNTPASGLISAGLAGYKNTLINYWENDPIGFLEKQDELIEKTRSKISSFLETHRSLTGLLPNFSFAFNSLLDLLPKNSRFLLLDDDYPSINYAVESRKFKCTYATTDQNLEDNILQLVQSDRPDVLCLSLVQYLSGIKIDFDFIKNLKRDNSDLLIIADATQYLGVEEFRFRESGIDILIASCYKWMNAGTGSAIIALQQQAAERLVSFNSHLALPESFSNQRGTLMGHFEPGHHDVIAVLSLKFAIEEIEAIGLSTIQNRIETTSISARELLAEEGLLSSAVLRRNEHSSMFNLSLSDAQFQYLYDHKIICAKRGNGVRIGFHYYNDQHDLDQLITTIKSAK
jgi:selenocysteine lyase/cysteine desulfurase